MSDLDPTLAPVKEKRKGRVLDWRAVTSTFEGLQGVLQPKLAVREIRLPSSVLS